MFDVELDADVMNTICALQKSLYHPPLPPPPRFPPLSGRDRAESASGGANVGLGFRLGVGYGAVVGDRQGAADKPARGSEHLEDLEPRVNATNGNVISAPPTPRQANGVDDSDDEGAKKSTNILLEQPKKGAVKLKPITRVEGFEAASDSGE